jgi:branched-chain amino acid transport system permease protein
MELFSITLVSGIAAGCTFGLVGLAFTAIFNASRIINFANGDLAMVGAFAGSVFLFPREIHPAIGFFGVLAISIIAGLFIHQLTEPSVKRGAPLINTILITLGAGLILSGSVGLYTKFGYFRDAFLFGTQPLVLGAMRISPQYIAIVATTALLSLAYWFLLYRTHLGLTLRALGINSYMASLSGINAVTHRGLTWGISAAISGIAGFLIAPLMVPSALMGLPLVINGFIAAVVGGLGNPLAAIVGGIVVGLLLQFFSAYVSAGNAQFTMFLLLLIVLMVRPKGLLGRD